MFMRVAAESLKVPAMTVVDRDKHASQITIHVSYRHSVSEQKPISRTGRAMELRARKAEEQGLLLLPWQ